MMVLPRTAKLCAMLRFASSVWILPCRRMRSAGAFSALAKAERTSCAAHAMTIRYPFMISLLIDVHRQHQAVMALAFACSNSQRIPASVRDPATVDRQTDAIDKPLPIAIGEKSDRRGDIFRSREARHRHAMDDILVGVGTAALVRDVHFGLDPTGAHCVDTNPAATPFGGERARETNQSVLRGVIGAAMADARQARH